MTAIPQLNASAIEEEVQRVALNYAVPIGGKIVGAIILWIVGRAIIRGVQRVAESGLKGRKIDPTLARYVHSVIGVTLTLLLFLAILSVFGVETTSFAGILAAAGVAIGMAWSGLLSNFAAGVFLMVLRPFKVGDAVTAAGVTGTVMEIGLFSSSIDTADNIRTYVGNAKIFGDTIQNYSANEHRTVLLKAVIPGPVDLKEAMPALREAVAKIPNVVKDPGVVVELLEFGPGGHVLAVRPSCHNDHYWDVYFATNEAIAAFFKEKGYWPPGEPSMTIHMAKPAA